MKKLTMILVLILMAQGAHSAQIVERQVLPDGSEIKMCNFDNGGYGYCTLDDKNNAIRASYDITLQKKTAIQQINVVRNTVSTGVDVIDTALDGVRVITSFFGR